MLFSFFENRLSSNVPLDAGDDRTVVVVSSEGLPGVEAGVDGVVSANILVSDDGAGSDTVVGHGDDLTAEGVVLGSSVLGEDGSGDGNEGHVARGVGEVGAETAGSVLPEGVAAGAGVTEGVDGEGVVAGDVGGSGDGHGQSGDNSLVHFERVGWLFVGKVLL